MKTSVYGTKLFRTARARIPWLRNDCRMRPLRRPRTAQRPRTTAGLLQPGMQTAAELERREERRVARFRAAAVDVAPTADRQEIIGLLWAAARLGSVQAAKTLLEELRRESADTGETGGIIDELARKREKAAKGEEQRD